MTIIDKGGFQIYHTDSFIIHNVFNNRFVVCILLENETFIIDETRNGMVLYVDTAVGAIS